MKSRVHDRKPQVILILVVSRGGNGRETADLWSERIGQGSL